MTETMPPVLSVVPTRALVDEKFKVVVENLPLGSPVTLHSLHHSEDKDYWEAFGHYVSDHRGVVSVAENLSLGGTYTGIEAMGLLWSMRPTPGSRKGLRLRKLDICTPMLFNISVYDGFVTEGFMERTPLALVTVERWYKDPGVRRIDIREKGVRGTLFVPPGPGPFPGLLDIWGGGGGLVEYRSALLASRGYVSLALEYFSTDELASADLQIRYFETAFNIIRDHPQVAPDRVGIFGLSLGSIMTMYLAAESTVIKPRCCVCISSHHMFRKGDTLQGFHQAILKHSHLMHVDENNHHKWRDVARKLMTNSSHKLDVGKIKCQMLLICGLDDQNTPAAESAEDVARMMRAAGNEHLLTTLLYPDTGHLIEPPFSPHFRASNFVVQSTKQKVIMLWGGRTKPHSDAQEDSWRKILAFLRQHLYSSPTLKAKM